MKDLKFEDALITREGFVTEKLREGILNGSLKPGHRLDQAEIAEVLKVSRSPVREAIRTLAAEGLIEIIPHRGAIVAELSLAEIEEIYFLRIALEGMAARLAAPNINAEIVTNLISILEELDQTENPTKWLELNHQFHYTIYGASKRPRLLSMSANLRNTAAPYIGAYISKPENRNIAQKFHREIFEACLNHDGVRAQQATEEHLNITCQGLIQVLKDIQQKHDLSP